MRLVGALLFVALAGSFASAEDAKPSDSQPAPAPAPAPAVKAKVPLRVVRILPETHQALLFDKNKGTHVLADVGKTIDGFLVEDIDDDEVTLTAEGGAQIVLAAPDPAWRRHHKADEDGDIRPAKPAKVDKKAKAAPAPEDPYAATAPVDPYGDPEVRSVDAPAGPDGIRTAEAPAMAPTTAGTPTATAPTASPTLPSWIDASDAPTGSPTPTAPTTSTPTAAPAATAPTAPIHTATAPTATAPKATAPVRTATAPTTTTTPTAATAPKAPSAAETSAANTLSAAATGMPATDAMVLSRADVNAALGNFASLTGSVKGSFTPAGVKLDAVAADSLFAKAGLKSGDVITAVNNQPLKSIDDAANLYARAAGTKALLVAVTRANKPITLRVVIQ